MLHVIGIDSKRENMTIGALKALEKSDVVIGCEKHLNMVLDIIEGKKIPEHPIKDRLSLVELGISLAVEGKEVALIDSNDSEVFGMGNLLFQTLGKYDDVDFKIYPGVTAINYGTSLIGAPLTDFVAINLNNKLITLNEIKEKLESTINSNYVLNIYNPSNKEHFKLIKKVLLNLKNPKTPIAIINISNGEFNNNFNNSNDEINNNHEIIKLKDLNHRQLSSNTLLIIGNQTTYLENNKLITPEPIIIKPNLHPLTKQFYTDFLEDKSPKGVNKSCEYYPCHNMKNQQCDFCFCPFYPCADGSTGGKWIKNKNVWNCIDCTWIHEKKVVDCVKDEIKEIIHEVDDLKTKKEDLMKLRRKCIFKTKLNS
jgi:precorrin-3B C17-methyltransferase